MTAASKHMVYCIGDSHVSFFAGEDRIQPQWPAPSRHRIPGFRVFHLGPALAYNLTETGTRSQGRERLMAVLEREVPGGATVMLCFGEIDCRAHLLRQAEMHGDDIGEIVRRCAERYVSVVREVKNLKFNVLVWNAIPSSPYDVIPDERFPVHGTCGERNRATRLFNENMEQQCRDYGISVISIFDHLVDERGLTKPEFMMDYVHLSQRAMPIALETLSTVVPTISTRMPALYRVRQTSFYVGSAGMWGRLRTKWKLHRQRHPWIFRPRHQFRKGRARWAVLVNRLPEISIDSVARPLNADIKRIEDDSNLPPTQRQPHDDFTPLARIIQTVAPQNVLELGTAYGNTTANICALCDAHVYTVNALPEQMAGSVTTFTLTRDDIGRVFRKHDFAHRVTQIYENTLEFDHRQYFPEPIIDLAIIDACHDAHFVVNDFLKTLPTLREGAVVLLHDTHPSMSRHLVGSYSACAHLRPRGFDVRHIESTWWGYWKRPKGEIDLDPPPRLRRRILSVLLGNNLAYAKIRSR